jgi:hypothetical protein
MKKNVLWLTATLALLLGFNATAQVKNLSIEQVDNEGKVPGKTYRLYAVMTHEEDRVLVIFGDTLNPLIIKASKPFYQSPNGGGMAKDSNRKLVQLNDSLRFDSWITVGGVDNYDCNINVLNLSLQKFEEEGGPIEVTTDGAWFTLPTDQISKAGSDKKILLGQFTTKGTLDGQLCIMGRDAKGENFQQKGLKFNSKH